MERKKPKESFWVTLPGILTGAAALVTAIAGLIAALYTAGIISHPGPTSTSVPSATDKGSTSPTPAAPSHTSPTPTKPSGAGSGQAPPAKKAMQGATAPSPPVAHVPSTAPPTPTVPAFRIVSSGQAILKGSYTFDFVTGQQGVSPADADIHWEIVSGPVRYLNARNGAQFSYLGRVDFDRVSVTDLRTAHYSATRLDGTANSGNQLTDGAIVLVRTKGGSFCKLMIEKYGVAAPGDLPEWPKAALLIKWVTFGSP